MAMLFILFEERKNSTQWLHLCFHDILSFGKILDRYKKATNIFFTIYKHSVRKEIDREGRIIIITHPGVASQNKINFIDFRLFLDILRINTSTQA